jgi:hypothetical protein
MTYFSNRRRRRRSRYSNRRRRHHNRRHRRHYNRRRRHHNRRRRRHYNRRHRRHRRSWYANASSRFNLQTVKRGFSKKALVFAASGAVGYKLNPVLTAYAEKLPGVSMLAAYPIGDALLRVAMAGVTGAVLSFVPSVGGPLGAGAFAGGLIQVGVDLMGRYVFPYVPGLRGLGDYLTVSDAANARPLGFFGDYLTPQAAAAARPLGFMGSMSDNYVGEELAAL